jgi:hypothetical protein
MAAEIIKKRIGKMQKSFQLGMISLLIALAPITAAFACNVGTTVSPENFIGLTQCVDNLETQVRALQATIAQLNGAKGMVAIKALDDHVPHNSVNDDWSGMTGTISLGDSRAVCPPGSWVSGIQGFKISGEVVGLAGPIEPLSELRFSCRGLQ